MNNYKHGYEVSPYNELSTMTDSNINFEFSHFKDVIDVMSMYHIIVDENKTISKALDEAKNGDTIRFTPGDYRDININFVNSYHDISFKGSGKNCILTALNITGDTSISFHDMKVGNFKFDVKDGSFDFHNISFIRATLFKLSGKTSLNMTNCKIEKGFQLIIDSGEHKITMRSCDINSIMPYILVRNGNLLLNVIDTHSEKSIVVVENGKCVLREMNSILPENPCVVVKSGECINSKNSKNDKKIYKSSVVNSSNRSINCKEETEYIEIIGEKGSEFDVTMPLKGEMLKIKINKNINLNVYSYNRECLLKYMDRRDKTITFIRTDEEGWYVDNMI